MQGGEWGISITAQGLCEQHLASGEMGLPWATGGSWFGVNLGPGTTGGAGGQQGHGWVLLPWVQGLAVGFLLPQEVGAGAPGPSDPGAVVPDLLLVLMCMDRLAQHCCLLSLAAPDRSPGVSLPGGHRGALGCCMKRFSPPKFILLVPSPPSSRKVGDGDGGPAWSRWRWVPGDTWHTEEHGEGTEVGRHWQRQGWELGAG